MHTHINLSPYCSLKYLSESHYSEIKLKFLAYLESPTLILCLFEPLTLWLQLNIHHLQEVIPGPGCVKMPHICSCIT